MKLSNKITKFQEGGPAPAPQPAPAADPAVQGAEQDPVAQLLQMAQEALSSENCEAALMVCDGLMQILSQGQEGGGSPAAEQGAPVYRKGGVLVRRTK